VQFFIVNALDGLSFGLLLFMLASGLTLIFSMLGVLNFAHASFYMLGAYLAYAVSTRLGFWPALALAPLLVGALGALTERLILRRVRRRGQLAELLVTFGLAYLILELVRLAWGLGPLPMPLPSGLSGPLFSIWGVPFPRYRAFMMAVSAATLLAMFCLLRLSRIGLVIQAALTHAPTVEALGHDVPGIFTLVFAVGTGLAGLAGVLGGHAFVLEPSLAESMGSIVFVVVVVGGMGSLSGAFVASLLIGILQTFAVTLDVSLASLSAPLLARAGIHGGVPLLPDAVSRLTVAEMAPVLPYLLLVAVLIVRPGGLSGKDSG
jgi:branched-chain amino acid transport system permease protein